MYDLKLHDVKKSFSILNGTREVLHGVTLTVQAGEIVAVLGSNGAGKTTLFRCIQGELATDGGTVCYGDRALPDKSVTVVSASQDPLDGICPSLTARENLALAFQHEPGFLASYPAWRPAKQIESAAAAWELGDSLDQPAESLSGGQQQRLSLLLALIRRPDVILLDEITANLDVNGAERVERVVFSEIRELRAPTLLVTHDHSLAHRVADAVVYLENGIIQ